jgi:hypothetical protein
MACMTKEPIVCGPAEDHDPAHAYAVYMVEAKRKVYGHTYLGARWELALARHLGPTVLERCQKHLARVGAHHPEDFWLDFRAGEFAIDAKSTFSRRRPASRNNLLITPGHLRPHVAYVLGDVLGPTGGPWPVRDRDGREDLQFEAPGWTLGLPELFKPCEIPGIEGLLMMERRRLRPLSELVSLVQETEGSSLTEPPDA